MGGSKGPKLVADGDHWCLKNRRKEGKNKSFFRNKIRQLQLPTIMGTGRKEEKRGSEIRLTSSSDDRCGEELRWARWWALASNFRRSSLFGFDFLCGRKGEGVSPLNRVGGKPLSDFGWESVRGGRRLPSRVFSSVSSFHFFFIWAGVCYMGWAMTFFPSKRNFILNIFFAWVFIVSYLNLIHKYFNILILNINLFLNHFIRKKSIHQISI